ncbi:hypothetical protein [Bifidobacterium adolescentis]|uniref:hypothetical protein n=1 Tax=Bifidobacterium adolescentis TaxID=1680 RepID=UPI0040630481
MADHVEIRPDDASLPLTLADIALRNSNMRLTYLSGTIAVDNGDGTETWIGGGDTGAAMPGSNGIIPWVGDTTPPGRPTGVTAVCRTECVFVQWDGTLEGGVPADFDHVELYAKPDSTGESLDLGQLRGKGELATGVLPVGDVVEVWAVAYDNAHDVNGVSKPNASDESEHATVIIAPIVSQQDLNDTASEILDVAKSDAAAQVKKVSDGLDSARKDIDANTDAANALKSQQTQLRSDLDAAAKKIDANAQGVDAVRKQQDTADAALKSLGKTVEDNKSAQDAINAQQAETNKTIAANKTALADASKQLEQAKADIKTGQADLADARETLADNTAKLVQARKDIAANQAAQASASKELESAKSDIRANQSAINSANATLRDNTAKLTQARKDIQANRTGLDSASKSLAQAQSDLSQARKDIAQTKSDLTTANGEISKAKESAAQAYAEAHSKNHTFRGPDEPKDNLIVGDLWLKTQKYWTRWQGEKNNSPSLMADFYTYWTGAPNASPSVLVPLADRVIDTLVWDGSNWNHLGYADVEKNADEISKAKSDIADNAAKTTDAKKAAENAAAAAKNAQGTADTANGAAKTAQDTANAANAAAKSATATAGQAKDAANAAQTAAESAKKTAGNAETLANTANASANAAKSDAASAKTDASTAKTDAANAKTTAANASSVATQAKATADSAAQSATDAANAAQKANTAAAAAAGVANGKADVLIQSTAPATSMRKPTTLWIDTTGGANTPKRWNGSAWVAVTDKAATDAANAAVKAHAAAQTAQSTADKAQAAAANAASQANQAQAAAKKAQTTADGKNLIYRGPDEPAHDGLKPGDMWWRTQKYWTRWQGEKNNSPSLMADFYTYWTGAPNASPSVLVPLTDRVIEVLTWDGTRFEPFDLVANNILAAGTVAAKHLAADSVTAEKVKANAITVDKLAANSVTTEKLVSDAVTAGKLAAGSVQARNIVALAITADKLASNSVTTSKLKVTEDMTVALLNAHKIQASDIVSGAVTTDKLAANAVNADKLAANAVTAGKVQAGAIGTDKLAANSVTTAKLKVTEDMTVALLSAHRINASDIVAGAVTTDKLATNSVNADKIAANAVTSDKIVANAVTSDKILANSVTTAKLKVTEDMTVALLKAHQIQAGELAANSVTGQNIKADALYGKTIQGGVFRTSDGRMVINDAGIVAKAKSGRKRQAYYTYWQGEPNNSPSVLVTVDLADDESFVLDSQSGTVAMCGEILSGSTISGTSIVGSEFRTANSRMLLNDSGLVLRNTQGKATVTLNAASGSATFSGTVTGSTITGGTVSGAVITGSAFTSPDGKTKLNSSGFYVGDKLSYDAKSGVLSLKGSIQSGSDLSGVTVTGSTIQTSSTANRGLKLTSGGLVAYDGNGNAKFTLKSDGTIQMNGALLTNGKITAATLEGGTITGGTITGGMIQSSSAANTGFKLSGGALDFYDKSNNRTIHLNGTDNLLSGRFQTALSGPRLVLNNTTASDGSVYGLLKCYDANGVAWYTQGQSHGFNPSGQNDPGAYRRLNIGIDPSNSELSVVRFNSGASRIQMNAGRVDINGEDGWSKHIGGLGIYVNGSRIDPVVYTDLSDWFVPSSGWTAYAGDSGKDYRSHMTVIGNTCYMQLELQRSDKKSVTFNAGDYLDIGWFKEGFIPKIGLNVPCIFNNGQYGGAFVPGNTVPSTGDPDVNGDGVYLRGHLRVGTRQQSTAWWVSVFMMFTI